MLEKLGFGALIVSGLAAGWMIPGKSGSPAAAPQDQVIETVQRSGDGHFYVEADVNGTPVRFLVDTGASTVALSEADARKAGIAFDPSTYELLGQGASGLVRGQKVKLDEVKLGQMTQDHVDGAVVEGADVSLLGLPFLKNIDEIVIHPGDMELRDHG